MPARKEVADVYVFRADDGRYAKAFREGGYAGISFGLEEDLSDLPNFNDDTIRDIYDKSNPGANPYRSGQQLRQISLFLNEVQPGAYVVTPMRDSNKLMIGKVTGDYEYTPDGNDSPYPHRRSVSWFDTTIRRDTLSVPAQQTLSRPPTVFEMPQGEEILAGLGVDLPRDGQQLVVTQEAVRKLVLQEILELSPDEFEGLVTELLATIGFETRRVGRVGDGGVDVEGTLRVHDFLSADLKVQAKRYALGRRIGRKVVKDLRGSVPERSYAALVTTADFTNAAREEAEKPGFKKIGLINGKQLVGILTEHYEDLPDELKKRIKLQRILLPSSK